MLLLLVLLLLVLLLLVLLLLVVFFDLFAFLGLEAFCSAFGESADGAPDGAGTWAAAVNVTAANRAAIAAAMTFFILLYPFM